MLPVSPETRSLFNVLHSHNPHGLLRPSTEETLLPLNCCVKTSLSNKREETQKWNGLKIVRGKKLLKDLSTSGIGGPCKYFVEVLDQTQLLSAIRFASYLFASRFQYLFSVVYHVMNKCSFSFEQCEC